MKNFALMLLAITISSKIFAATDAPEKDTKITLQCGLFLKDHESGGEGFQVELTFLKDEMSLGKPLSDVIHYTSQDGRFVVKASSVDESDSDVISLIDTKLNRSSSTYNNSITNYKQILAIYKLNQSLKEEDGDDTVYLPVLDLGIGSKSVDYVSDGILAEDAHLNCFISGVE